MNQGKADQIGSPFEIYNRPTTKFVANFVGTLSTLDATVSDPAANTVAVGDNVVALPEAIGDAKAGDRITLALRPEALALDAAGGRNASLTGTVSSVNFLGSVIRTRLDVGGQSLSFDTFNNPSSPPPVPGDSIRAYFSPDDLLVLRD
jgi:putative spermidine/putrescine transport system ATP-binding protein